MSLNVTENGQFYAAFKEQLERNMVAVRLGWFDLLPRKFDTHKPCLDLHWVSSDTF